MKKKMKNLMMFAILAICLFAGFAGVSGNIDATDKYSWSANSGWCNMETASGSVTVHDTYLSGNAWNENTGWIKLGNDAGGPYNNTNSTDWGVNNDGDGNLSGYAWSSNSGWINFSTAQSQVKIDTAGNFSGYAWNENIGWIHFANSNAVTYTVKTSWSPSYTITAASGGNGTVAPATQAVKHGADAVAITATPSLNYHFVQWNDSNTDNPRTLTNITADQTITATFAIDTYTVTAASAGNGTVSPLSQSVNHGSDATAITATPSLNYHFTQWDDSNTDNPRTLINITADQTITANFAINTYTLTYTATANGSITGTTPQTVNHGSDGALVTAVPDANYSFVNWSDGVTTAARTDLNVTANISVTATFAIDTYTLTYTASANGSITGTTPQTVNHGSDGTLVTAVPDANYSFVNWSDGVTTAARTDLNVTANISVTATFSSGINLSNGLVILNKASEIPDFKNEYTRRPRVFGTYTDPISKKSVTRRSIARPITKIRSTGPSDFYDSEWRRIVRLFKKSDLLRANRREKMTTAAWLAANPIRAIVCKLYLRVKNNNGERVDVNFVDMDIAPPVITSIENWDNSGVLRGLHTSSIVIINGRNFGSRLPSVGYEYTNSAGKIKQKRLKVQRRYDYANARGKANKSCMDTDSGVSKVYVEMPKKSYTPGTYSLILDNKVGIALDSGTGTLPLITFIDESDNSAPVATDDVETIQIDSTTYNFDVLANDTDPEADKLTLSLDSKTTTLGGKVSVVSKKIRYSLPKDITFPFVDTFDYNINDGHTGTDTGTVTVTLNQIVVTSVTNWDGDALTTVQNSSIITIKGENFGVRSPVVSLRYTDAKGKEKLKLLRIASKGKYENYKGKANTSYTDLDTGISEVSVMMPASWWSNWVSGSPYTLVINNKKESYDGPTITTSDYNNIAPVANGDSATLYSGSLYFYIDVLANDKDIQSSKVKIILTERKTAEGGRVSVYAKTNQVKYIRPANKIANFTDSFTYYLKDSKGEISETVTVDLSINLN